MVLIIEIGLKVVLNVWRYTPERAAEARKARHFIYLHRTCKILKKLGCKELLLHSEDAVVFNPIDNCLSCQVCYLRQLAVEQVA